MPEGFDMCVRKGGKVRTKRLNKDEYMHICILNGKTYAGYPKKYKKVLGKKKK